MASGLLDGQVAGGDWLTDRGLAYGDGVFETIALSDGRLLALAAHLSRLQGGCVQLGIPPPERHTLERECLQVASGERSGVIKIIVTRGSGGRGYRVPPVAQPRRLVMLSPWPALVATGGGVVVWLCSHRLSINSGTAGMKHLNRLDQVIASREWPDEDCFEGLMQDTGDHLIEGTRSNLFLVQSGAVHTAMLDECGVSGIVRDAVIRWCDAQGVQRVERRLTLADLGSADEVFVTNSIIGVRAVNEIRGLRNLPAGPGPVTSRLALALRQAAVTP